ncbi:hypothetical protein BKA70DRAFT_501638 [Coprinopsis sp. MPI-PUGE-AT-0042]|nr:hypothetical protein BKA70DRAFT_501638 [Coprinopsis sp. MPI-PUGE-AT-0042]
MPGSIPPEIVCPSHRLFEAFQTSPILATYVQSLVIKQDWMQSGLKAPEVLEFLLDASAPITEFSCQLNLFVAWKDYPVKTRKSIITLCTLSRLSHLSLQGVPLEDLHFGGLQHLKSLCIVSAPDLDPSLQRVREDQGDPGPPAQIGELLIAPDPATLDFIVEATGGLDLGALKVLTLDAPLEPWWEMTIDVAPLFSLCSNSLVEIHLQSESAYLPHRFFSPDKQRPLIDLRGRSLVLTDLVNLQIITISVIEGGIELQYSCGLFLRLGAMLQTLPCPNSLRVMQLGERDEPKVSLGPGMQQLDIILSQPKFCCLERLILLVSAPSEEALIAHFPKLQHRGVLCIPGAQEEDGDMILSSASDRVNYVYGH